MSLALTLAMSLWSVACTTHAAEQPASGYAYVGPATLNLRKDLGPRAATIGSAKHGDRLEVVETRRRFVKVRTAGKIEGWTDGNLLLTEQQMGDLSTLAKKAGELPSQGTGTVFDPLNMHTQPNRQSPSFYQVAAAAPLDVVEHRVTAHGAPPEAIKPPAPKRVSTAKKSKAKESKAPDLPPPPTLPANWEAMSHPRASELAGYTPRLVSPAPQSSGADDWYLVRTRDGHAGWVLSRMVSMSVPDDVAQYAEGHRVTAYLALGEVQDKEKRETKQNWLWTTTSSNLLPYDFDSFRVFVWSLRRHRYETAFIERNVKGFYPVQAVDRPGESERAFSVVIEDKDGMRYKRTYGFSGYHVRLLSKAPAEPRPPLPEVRTAHNFDEAPPAPVPGESVSWTERWRARLEAWWRPSPPQAQ